MKNIISLALLFTAFLFVGCAESSNEDENTGSIYGILTEAGSAEPMRAMRIELWKSGYYMLGTVSSDDGQFEFTDLTPDNKYRLKVNAEGYEELTLSVVVEAGRRARADMQLKKIDTGMTVRTLDVSDLHGTSVTLNGSVEWGNYSPSPKEKGFYYSTSSTPLNGTKIKADNNFTASLMNLETGKYYVQAYAINSIGTAFGEIKTFEITDEPAVSTLEVTNVTSTTATLNGKIEYKGSPAYTERGFVYSSSHPTPTVDAVGEGTTKVVVTGNSQNFSSNVKDLAPGVTYHVRAYVTNSNGTFYGETIDFTTTSSLPVVKTLETTNITATTATLNAQIDFKGEPAFTERGFVYSSSFPSPTVDDPSDATVKVVVSGTSMEYSANVSSLIKETKYYVRAYIRNSIGVYYGETVSFKASDEKDYVIIENLAIQTNDLGKTNWNSAKELCKLSRVGGFSDWRLPTRAELALMYLHRSEIGNFKSEKYWSSQSYSSLYGDYSYYKDFATGSEDSSYPSSLFNVRAVRTVK